jgi:hypothetical protein
MILFVLTPLIINCCPAYFEWPVCVALSQGGVTAQVMFTATRYKAVRKHVQLLYCTVQLHGASLALVEVSVTGEECLHLVDCYFCYTNTPAVVK